MTANLRSRRSRSRSRRKSQQPPSAYRPTAMSPAMNWTLLHSNLMKKITLIRKKISIIQRIRLDWKSNRQFKEGQQFLQENTMLIVVRKLHQMVDTQSLSWISREFSSCRLWNLKPLESRGNMKLPQKTLKTWWFVSLFTSCLLNMIIEWLTFSTQMTAFSEIKTIRIKDNQFLR